MYSTLLLGYLWRPHVTSFTSGTHSSFYLTDDFRDDRPQGTQGTYRHLSSPESGSDFNFPEDHRWTSSHLIVPLPNPTHSRTRGTHLPQYLLVQKTWSERLHMGRSGVGTSRLRISTLVIFLRYYTKRLSYSHSVPSSPVGRIPSSVSRRRTCT